MRIILTNLKHFSQCPAYYSFLKTCKIRSRSHNVLIAETVIQKCYTISLETKFLADWRQIVGLVDTEVFKDIDVSTSNALKKGKWKAEIILKFLENFYSDIYSEESISGYVSMPLQSKINNHIIETVLPIVKITDYPTVLIINDIEKNKIELYNDIEIRGMLWLLGKSLHSEVTAAQVLTIGDKGGYSRTDIITTSQYNKRTEDKITQMLNSMFLGTNYPSVTEKCYSCSFKKECII